MIVADRRAQAVSTAVTSAGDPRRPTVCACRTTAGTALEVGDADLLDERSSSS
jgi:hypothetical protein